MSVVHVESAHVGAHHSYSHHHLGAGDSGEARGYNHAQSGLSNTNSSCASKDLVMQFCDAEPKRGIMQRLSTAAPELIQTASRKLVEKDRWSRILKSQGVSVENFEQEEVFVPFVDRNSFEIAIGSAIALNAIVMGIEADLRNDQNDDNVEWLVLENIFCFIWVFEVSAKCYYHHLKYFCSSWNIFDFLLAMLSVVDAWIMPAIGGTGGVRTLTLLRVMRFARMVRLLRLVRMMRMFRELWLIVNGFLESLRTLTWVLLLMGIVLYVSGIVMVHLVGRSCVTLYDDWPDCKPMFGSVGQSMYTLFQVITLESWSQAVARPVIRPQPYLVAFFVPFLFITTFGLLNVIVGVIVENTLEAAKQNSQLQARRMEMRLRRDLEMLRKVFEEADVDQSGGIDMNEFVEISTRPDVRKALKILQIPHNEPEAIFELMDVDSKNLLSVEDFVNSAMEMRKPPQALDMRHMTVSIRAIQKRFKNVEKKLKKITTNLKEESTHGRQTLLYPPSIEHCAGKPSAEQARGYGRAWLNFAAQVEAATPSANGVLHPAPVSIPHSPPEWYAYSAPAFQNIYTLHNESSPRGPTQGSLGQQASVPSPAIQWSPEQMQQYMHAWMKQNWAQQQNAQHTPRHGAHNAENHGAHNVEAIAQDLSSNPSKAQL